MAAWRKRVQIIPSAELVAPQWHDGDIRLGKQVSRFCVASAGCTGLADLIFVPIRPGFREMIDKALA
jgi:hypothetical protein